MHTHTHVPHGDLPAPPAEARQPEALSFAGAGDVYDADYYLRGQESGKSLYSDYRWLPELTIPMCHWIVQHLGIQRTDTILDFGCARGYVVKALRLMGYPAYGMDASEWAIDHADPAVKDHVCRAVGPSTTWDWIIAKDVLEHIPDGELDDTVDNLMRSARKGVFVVVPLSHSPGAPYVVPEYEQDVTHVQRLDLLSWIGLLQRKGFTVSGLYRLPGVKDNYSQYPYGNGFLKVIRDVQKRGV